MFANIHQILDIAIALSEEEAWIYAVDVNIQRKIIEMNTEDQLFNKGIDSLGKALGDYTPFSVRMKQEKGQRYDHITLKDTGAFYESFQIRVDNNGLTIIADDTSLYDAPLTDRFGLDVLGLTDENKKLLAEYLKVNYYEFIYKKIFQ
jgi:hypothetical protein